MSETCCLRTLFHYAGDLTPNLCVEGEAQRGVLKTTIKSLLPYAMAPGHASWNVNSEHIVDLPEQLAKP